jgi:hypothetical protein
MKIKKNRYAFVILFSINLLISIFAIFLFPERYFLDVKTITDPLLSIPGFIGSYPFSQRFYSITLLKYLPSPIVALIQFPITTYILYKIGIPNNFHKLNTKNILIYISFFLLAIYMSMPSKEFITFLMFCPIPFIYMSKKTVRFKIILSLFLFVCFSFFRVYYLLIPIFAVGMYLLSFIKFKNKTFSTIFYGLMIVVFLSFSHGIFKGEFLSQSTRENYFIVKSNKSVNSAIVSPISQETWYGEAFGIVYGFLAVNAPLSEGIKHILSPQILAFVIWQMAIFYIILVRFSRCLKNKKQYQFEFWTLLILISYFMVQGVFEPDLGSSIRHKIGFLPLIYFALYYEHFRKDIQQSI